VRTVLSRLSARAGVLARIRAVLVPVSLVPGATPLLKGRLTSGA
jgi:hypothetical protein